MLCRKVGTFSTLESLLEIDPADGLTVNQWKSLAEPEGAIGKFIKVIRRAYLRCLSCGTNRPFAGAAIASAARHCVRSNAVSATQRVSPERAFISGELAHALKTAASA